MGGARGWDAPDVWLPIPGAAASGAERVGVDGRAPTLVAGGGGLSELKYRHSAQRIASWITTQLVS